MHQFNNINYATTREVASVLGTSDTTLKKKIDSNKFPEPTEKDDIANRRYYSAEYIADSIKIALLDRKADHHKRDFITQAVGRITSSASLTKDFQQAVLDNLQACSLWPYPERPSGENTSGV